MKSTLKYKTRCCVRCGKMFKDAGRFAKVCPDCYLPNKIHMKYTSYKKQSKK